MKYLYTQDKSSCLHIMESDRRGAIRSREREARVWWSAQMYQCNTSPSWLTRSVSTECSQPANGSLQWGPGLWWRSILGHATCAREGAQRLPADAQSHQACMHQGHPACLQEWGWEHCYIHTRIIAFRWVTITTEREHQKFTKTEVKPE